MTSPAATVRWFGALRNRLSAAMHPPSSGSITGTSRKPYRCTSPNWTMWRSAAGLILAVRCSDDHDARPDEMKIGIALGGVRSRMWTPVTEEADRLGYESVWMPEHLVLPTGMEGSPFHGAGHPPVPPEIPVFDPFTYLGYLAGRTDRIRFGTHIYNIGLRHPFV